ncbi:MAG: DUF1232 domain-containing protein [Gemmatimonadota bacterium]|nr:MAG: DUF1232 domain-containing protein [Gemmatimonadota bacterium]
MQTQVIRELIARAVAHEQMTGTAAQTLAQAAFIRGISSTPQEVAQTVDFIRGYIERAPDLLEACESAARAVGIGDYAKPILEAAQQYFVSPLDVIFDHFGLIGLMDDAYFTQRLLQSISDAYRLWTGNPLLPVSLATANAVVRQLIGEPQASQLDLAIESTLGQVNVRRAFSGLTRYAQPLPLSDSDIGNGGIDRLLPDSLKSMAPAHPPEIDAPLPPSDDAPPPSPSAAPGAADHEEANLVSGYQTLLNLFNEKVEAGEFTPERQQALAPVLQELGDLLRERPQEVAGMTARVARLRELMTRMTTAVAEPTRPGEPLPAGSRGSQVNLLLQGVKRYLFIESGRANKSDEEQSALEQLFVRCAKAGTAVRQAGADERATTELERETFRKLALDVRNYALRHHLTLAHPIWPSPAVGQDPNTVCYSGGGRVGELVARCCEPRGLQVLRGGVGLDYAQARWDYLRRCSVALFDYTGTEAVERAAVSYELGICLALGRSAVIVARRDDDLPFDIDLAPVLLTGEAEDVELIGRALDDALYGQQRGGGGSSVRATIAYARRRFANGAVSFEVTHTLDLLDEAATDPLKVRYLLESLLGYTEPDSAQALYPAWPGTYPKGAGRRCFHVMPFSLDWSEQVMENTAAVCNELGVAYVRGDQVKDPRVIRSIWDEVCRASHVVADISDFNANVALELGLAHTLGRPSLIMGAGDTVDRLFPALSKLRVERYNREDEGKSLRALVAKFLS